MTYQQFKNKYLGKQVEYHSFGTGAKNQCVDLVNAYIHEVLDRDTKDYTEIIGTNAKDFATKYDRKDFEFIKNTPEGVPEEGDIVVWNGRVGGGAGHVAIFESGDVNYFISLDQNWSIKEKVTLEKHDYTNVIGWLRPMISDTIEPTIDAVTCETIDIPSKVEGKYLLKEFRRYDKHWTYGDLIKDWTELNEELDKQKAIYDEETKALIEDKKTLSKNLEGATQEINAKNSYIEVLEGKVDRLQSVINQLPTSAKGEFNSKDAIKWLKNTGLFALLPLAITYLTMLQVNIPKEYAVLIVPLLAVIIDYLKKLLRDNR